MPETPPPPARPEDGPLPVLRADVTFHPGPEEADGSPTYLLHEPLFDTWDRLEWPEYEIVRRLRRPTTLSRLLRQLHAATTLRETPEAVHAVAMDVERRGLSAHGAFRDPLQLERLARSKTPGRLSWLLRHYLYFRLPLWKPDRFLDETLSWARPLGGRVATGLTVLAACLAVWLLAPRWEAFVGSFGAYWSLAGAVELVFALGLVKLVHELAHLYAARALGVHVRAAGIAFMVMCPFPYSDVTNVWRVRSRRERLSVAVAGMRAELTIAAWALLGWCVLPPGGGRDLCFALSAMAGASTLLTNLNPGMRFDGYYLLSDLLGVDNLQARGFGYFRRAWRRALLGMPQPEPETRLNPGRRAGLLAYAAYAIVYRTFLYAGIAVLVYYMFPKAIGIVLFAVEAAVFLARPVVREAVDLVRDGRRVGVGARAAATLAVAAAVAFWLAWPLPRRIHAPATTVAAAFQNVYAPEGARLAELPVRRNDRVREGQLLARLEVPELDRDIEGAELELAGARLDLERAAMDNAPEARYPLRERLAAVEEAEARVRMLRSRRSALTLRSRLDGRAAVWNTALAPGDWLAGGQPLGTIQDGNPPRVAVYVPERYAADLSPGDRLRFRPDSGEGVFEGVVVRAPATRAEWLSEPELARPAGGTLDARPADNGLLLPGTYYRVLVELSSPGPAPTGLRTGQTGQAEFSTAPKSWAAELARRLWEALTRESGF